MSKVHILRKMLENGKRQANGISCVGIRCGDCPIYRVCDENLNIDDQVALNKEVKRQLDEIELDIQIEKFLKEI